ncbi:MAG: FixH family protein [Ktedonobacteraceae bacterium]|nr:FixH family protein [Ktedonobacteraceae bacterium]
MATSTYSGAGTGLTMQIRPVFWLLLLFSCASALIFWALYPPDVPAVLQVHVTQQRLDANGLTTLEIHLTDPQGIPLDHAQVVPSAYMTNMAMSGNDGAVHTLGAGKYQVQMFLYMEGPWAITISAQADGFLPQQQTLYVNVG